MAASAESLRAWLQAQGIVADDRLYARLGAFYELLLAANRQTNLTRITAWDEFLVKHVADSLLALALPDRGWTGVQVLDLGCGAGFPAVPLALACPRAEVLAVDSRGKKAAFVAEAAAALELANLQALQGRGRELSRSGPQRNACDVVTARAVADGPTLIRECKGLLAPGGELLAYKTPEQVAEEAALVRREAAKAKLAVSLSEVMALPEQAGTRQFWRLSRSP